ncbi:M20/M25/M40 family metallo-hydrolase [Streptomonospora nanhaiensis]|uniref:M20/M25/M40 family metallo-hydrolase n=1 Tax=Streptomonospora nanhaiensis TaxID=1323731 RepID=UPI001C388AD9|nr:M20/M25/M40 family metallo-hydrolase [Streptomonospora nanhaiensis]MBV2366054.1 M20/M25/M40 family metallo-hydrolase [Streptomonospora nanhaiensis]MBX9389761.1 M20/M25/M40 family metallo-hydrolase [Streptomonospora nanhaiensis]
MSTARLTPADHRLLLRLLELPTAGPLETGPGAPPPRLRQAQRTYAEAAAEAGCVVVHHGAPDPAELERPEVPEAVRRAAADPAFLADQPSLVLRLGPPLPRAATAMFNVHLDTVAGDEPVSFDGTRFHGRGAADAKGPAVALLAGLRAARAADPAVGTEVGVLVQAVAGEEGGAMGVFGTRPLVERGLVGRLNVFCEPTGLRYLPRCTAAMTARVRVRGRDSIDDRPGEGHNATVLLGFLAQYLAEELAHHPGGTVCVAGLHTGTLHNRVYGRGDLLLNLAYASSAAGRRLGAAVEAALDSGLAEFSRRFAAAPPFALTAADARAITRLDWLKRGLPTLDGPDPWLRDLMERAGVEPWPADARGFTCDAIWMAGVPGAAAAVLGPGDLAANNAHAQGEFADLADLDAFADTVARLLLAFADDHRQRNGAS